MNSPARAPAKLASKDQEAAKETAIRTALPFPSLAMLIHTAGTGTALTGTMSAQTCTLHMLPSRSTFTQPSHFRSRTSIIVGCSGEASTSGRGAQNTEQCTERSVSRRGALVGAVAGAALIAAQDARAASKLKDVVDGGVTVLVPSSTTDSFSPAEKKSLENNRRIQQQNNVPSDFPSFVRQGYDIKIMADGYDIDEKGLIYKDFEQGSGPRPEDGQQVTFDYTAYNENGNRIDSSYKQGRPAMTRLGINGLIPGFELGIKGMQVGGKRRIVVSPELGPPVGPSTFFSAKQCEVFDVQLRDVKSCRRRQVAMFSDVVCE